MKLIGENIYLRAIEPNDINSLYQWENNTDYWKVSNTQTPYSKNILEQYIANAHQDIYAVKQLRLIICNNENEAIGTIDLFEFDPNHLRAGIGILIGEEKERGKGYASEALKLLIDYCFETLNLHQLFCNISPDNEDSILLFQKHNFQITGIKKQWNRVGSTYVDELLLQRIKN